MKLSIIIPAFNEERLITDCIESIRSAIAAREGADIATELIVVDNNSTDRTAEIATQLGARVCFEKVNQIARARNAGAEAARGDWLMFVDADSVVSPALLADILALVESGATVGCGSTVRMDGLPLWGRIALKSWNRVSIVFRWAAGSLFVCRADAFQEVGGFSRMLYAAEEIDLSRRLKKWGCPRGLKFVIVRRHPLATSARKLKLYSGWEIAKQFLRLCLRPRRALQDKKHLSLWYDGRRE
jgi:glycosyltransferase involved in cell wall biosynthesis